jgi:hypothetical protein
MLYESVLEALRARWRTRLAVAIPMLPLLVAACSQAPAEPGDQWDPAEERGRLADAMARFQATAPSHYVFRYTRRCPCDGELANPSLAVREGVIEEVWDVTTGACLDPAGYGKYYSIEGFFALVEQAIDDGVDRLSVGYHPGYGHPTAILIDPDGGLDGDELDFPLISQAQAYDDVLPGWCVE